jgi:hypothetical protein
MLASTRIPFGTYLSMTQTTVFARSGNLASTTPTKPYSSSSLNFTCTVVLSTIFRLGCAMNCTLLPRLMSNSSSHRGCHWGEGRGWESTHGGQRWGGEWKRMAARKNDGVSAPFLDLSRKNPCL